MCDLEVLVLRGASPASVAITFELLATANRLRRAAGRPAAFAVRISGSGAQATRAFLGHEDATFQGPPQVVVTPGLGLADEATLDQGLARPDAQAARRRLCEAAAAGAEVASSCSGVFLLASAGLLDGRRATTSWWLAPIFRRRFPQVTLDTEAMVVADRGMTTAGAAMAQLDLMLSVVARRGDRRLADQCARYLLLDERSSQARYMALSYLAAADAAVAQAEGWARERLGQPFTTGDLAAAAGLSPRTFARRLQRTTGLSPVRFVQRMRVERAIELLETTRLSFEQIAWQIGYAEPSTLRRLLRREGAAGARTIRSAA